MQSQKNQDYPSIARSGVSIRRLSVSWLAASAASREGSMSSLARQPSDDGSEDAKERFQGPNAAGSQTGEASKPATGKRTRNRTPASCDPCRKRKLRCDRLYVSGHCSVISLKYPKREPVRADFRARIPRMPCDSCIGRSEADGCTYGEGAAPLYGDSAFMACGAFKLTSCIRTDMCTEVARRQPS